MEPKSGKLHKLGLGLFGPKWTEKWVHLDGTLLKCFPMAVEQQVFSLGSSRQSSSYELTDYKLAVADEKKVNRKFAFQLETIAKSSKPVTFACSSEKELAEWRFALTTRLCLPSDAPVSPVISEKIRRAAEAFSEIDPRNTGKIDSGKLRGWEGKDSELALMQQQLDLGRHGVITRTRLLTWLQSYYCAQEVMNRVKAERTNNQIAVEVSKPPELTERTSSRSSSARVAASKLLICQVKTDWDQRYNDLLSKGVSTDVLTTGSEISGILAEFRQAAEVIVSEIVAEMTLEDAHKTLQPQSLDDDEVFATDGVQQYSALLRVMLKFQRDGLLVYLCSSSSSSGAAREKKQNTASIAIFHRMVGHQVRAARTIHEAIEETKNAPQASSQYIALQVPLQCIVDHLGFRAFVIASTDSALKSTRRDLGSQAKKNRVKRLQDQLKPVFDNLGLLTDSLHTRDEEQHAATTISTVPAFFPVSAGFTVAIRDGASVFKLQNLADLIPADVSSDDPDSIAREALMYKMRPEFVRMHGNNLPLHSNTHISIEQVLSVEHRASTRSQLEAQLLQQSAISAQECLHTVIIPEFVADLESGTTQVIDSRSLTRALHGEGINVRYLASCYELASLKHIRRALLAEMVARACKIEFRASLRLILPEVTTSILRQAKATGNSENGDANDGDDNRSIDPATARALAKMALQEQASHVTLEFVNLVFGTSSRDSKTFWERRILPQVYAKFGISQKALNLDTIISEDLLHMPQLFHALQAQTGAYFSDHMNYNFKGAEPIALQNIQCISPRTTLLARTTAACERVLESADAFLAAGELSSALSSIMFHIYILETAPSDERNLSLCHLLTCAANISLAMNLPDQAKKLATLAIEESPSNHADLTRAYTILMKLKHASSDLAGAQECFTKALEPIQWHLGPVHPLLCDTYMTMTEILGDLSDPGQAVETLQSCVTLVRDCFGKTSLLYADIRRQQGMLMLAANSIDGEAVIGVFEDALSVYERHFQDPVEDVFVYKAFAAECCYLLANLRTQVLGSQAAESAYGIALTALALRKEVLPANHEEIMKSFMQLGSLSRELGEHYRAVDYFKPALFILKTIHDDEHIDQIRSVTQTMLQLHLRTLSHEKSNVVDRTAKRFEQQWPRFALLSAKMTPETSAMPASDDDTSEESALLIFVMKKLFQLEPIEYVDQLIEKTDLEFQDYRKQYNLNFAGTMRRNNADTPSPQRAMLRSSSGRFASFSGAGTFSPPGSPRAPLSPMRHPTLFPGSPRGRTSFNQLDCNFLKASTGDFTFGAQLAAILFLIDHPASEEDTKV
ncbi:Translation initiation factor eIF3 subunit-containing protein [Phytophthora infestans]|nr:Translation initiation factor eIF3 subunit-containing protein [Phytophthora infestans]